MDLERYRKDAKALVRAYRSGDADASARARAVLGERAEQRFRLSDAQHVVAVEHGYRTWPELKRATHEGQREGSPRVVAAIDALDRDDVDTLRAMLDDDPGLAGRVHGGAWETLLEALAEPDVVEGFPQQCATLLIERTTDLDGPLSLAACFDKPHLVRMLVAAGADPAPDPQRGLTPLESALYHGSRGAAEALAEHGISPLALWSAAALGRIDLMEQQLGQPQTHRPNLADVGWQPGPPARDDPQTILDEALCFAAINGRDSAVDWLLEHGADVSGAPYEGMTPLHFAVVFNRPTTVRNLRAAGADTTVRDRIHNGTPAAWAHHLERPGLVALLEGYESGLEYVPGEPVRLNVDVRRWYELDDGGRALELAGRPNGWREIGAKIEKERSVNVTRSGVVALPVMGPYSFDEIAGRVAAASLAFYEDLLDLD